MIRKHRNWLASTAGAALLPMIIGAGAFCTTHAVSFTEQIQGGTVYVTEPIDYRVSAAAADQSPVTVQAGSLPTGATFNGTTGMFSWRPALGDTGAQVITFTAGQGTEQVTMDVNYTVVLPVLDMGNNEYIKVLRPSGGEVFTYGDTLMLAFVMAGCNLGTDIGIVNNGITYRGPPIGCPYAMADDFRLNRGGDSLDLRGVECRYFRHLDEADINLGFYKLPLVDTLLGSCSALFGGGTGPMDSIRIAIMDQYANYGCFDPMAVNFFNMGAKSGYFSVAPYAASTRPWSRRFHRSISRNAASGKITLYTVHGRRLGALRNGIVDSRSLSSTLPAGACIAKVRGEGFEHCGTLMVQ